jgi:hypothetical protein
VLELLVQTTATFQFTLLEFYLVFVTVSILAFPVPGLVKLNIGGFAVNLNVLELRYEP